MFETHRALPSIDGVIQPAFDHSTPGNIEAFAADTGAMVPLDHGNLIIPFSMAEVTEHI